MTAHPLRIAMTSYYLPSESKIGAGYMAHRLANVMQARGHEVTMFSPCVKPSDAVYSHVHTPITGSIRTFTSRYTLGPHPMAMQYITPTVVCASAKGFWHCSVAVPLVTPSSCDVEL